MRKKEIKELDRIKNIATGELIARAKRARKEVAKKIRKAAENAKIATNKSVREKVYNDVTLTYTSLARGIDSIIKEATADTAKNAHTGAILEKAAAGIALEKGVVAFDAKRIEKYWSMIHPTNQNSLAAVFTENMSNADVRALRLAFIDNFRQAQIEGWTANQIHKNLQARWWQIAGRIDDRMFIDAAGREWANADYLRMLTRTTLHKVATETYVDTLVDAGDELAMINTVMENCPICDSWDRVIISLTGKSKKYPSYREALAAGWHHPNCDCVLDGVVIDLEEDEVNRQADIKHPGPIKDDESQREYAEKMQRYNDKIKIAEKKAEGMTAEQADIALKRDKLLHRVQVANLSRFDDAIKAIPDDVLKNMKQDNLPRFGYTKKGDKSNKPAWNTKSSRGGIIHVDRDPDKEGGTVAAFNEQLKDLFGKSGVEWK